MDAVFTETRDGFTLKLFLDEDSAASNPRDNDNIDTLCSLSDRYLGDKLAPEFNGLDDFEERALAEFGEGFIFEHVNTHQDGDHALVMTKADRVKEWGKGPHAVRKARKYLAAVGEEYAAWAEGEVYGYTVKAAEGHQSTIEESCWGFIGFDYAKREALDVLKGCIARHKRNERETRSIMHL